jgi:hypothetical protein
MTQCSVHSHYSSVVSSCASDVDSVRVPRRFLNAAHWLGAKERKAGALESAARCMHSHIVSALLLKAHSNHPIGH